MRGPGVDGLCVTIRGDEITADAEAMAFLNGEPNPRDLRHFYRIESGRNCITLC